MPRFSSATPSRYLLHGRVPYRACLHPRLASTVATRALALGSVRHLHCDVRGDESTPGPASAPVPFRQQLKEQFKKSKAAGKSKKRNASNQVIPGWELSVGIEIHAQLNTARKLFSRATTSFNDEPNSHVAYFDLAMPGSQPVFQKETLIPALRAALALRCDVQRVSRFDRKHYFHWDQPSGYQITQYYEPFARDGKITLQRTDGIAAEDGTSVTIGIKQVQMEQDTAKTLAGAHDEHWVDFNRTGVPLIEIISLPDIHYPATAAAFVRKVQSLLGAADACVLGMEMGGLRADVNVSVRPCAEGTWRLAEADPTLGTRTEIKNLSSLKSVEDAIIAERDRQIHVLQSGGVIEGETRGWSIGSTETRRLRGKEGEVDYRYMPDPDLPPIFIGEDLLNHLRETMGQTPDEEVQELMKEIGLTEQDATSLVSLDGGRRVEYFWTVRDLLSSRLDPDDDSKVECFRLASNWILHQLGKLTAPNTATELHFTADGRCEEVPADALADILMFQHQKRITAKVAKQLLWAVYGGTVPRVYSSIRETVDKEDLWFKELSHDEYNSLADAVLDEQDSTIREWTTATFLPRNKLGFLLGRMMQLGQEERIKPEHARALLEEKLQARIERICNETA